MKRGRSFAVRMTCLFAVLLISLSGCNSKQKSKVSRKEESKQDKKAAGKGSSADVAGQEEERIAFVKDGDVWTMKADGSDKKQLTNTPQFEFSLSFSAQAGRIWFVRTTADEWEELPVGDVWSMRTDGTDQKLIVGGQVRARFAAVSPDGKNVGICLVKSMPATAQEGAAGETSDVWVMDANKKGQTEGSEHAELSDELGASDSGEMGREGSTFCAWSPDSSRIAFTFKADNSASLSISTRSLYIAKKDGAGLKKIGESMDQPAFSPNGKYIAAEKGMHWDTIGLDTVTTSGKAYKEVVAIPTGQLYSVGKPAWAGNGELVYATTTHPAQAKESATTLYLSDLDTLDQKSIVDQPKVKGTVRNPAVNSAGDKMVFEVEHFYAQGGEKTYYLWIVKKDGSGLKQITAGPEDTGPIWIKR